MNNFIRQHIREITPYEPVRPLDVLSYELGIPMNQLVKIDANENPFGISPSAQKRLANLRVGHIYPDPESRKLRQGLAEYLQVPYENLLVGSGADELIDLINRLSFNPGDKVIDCPPTFGFYSTVAHTHNLQCISVDRNDDFSVDLQGIKNAALNGAKGIFLANPNNPDGSMLTKETIESILQLPLLVVIDEAYIEFAENSQSLAHRILEQENLIVLRTFSKWGGLAGVRLGYGVFPSYYLSEIMKIKQPYNVSVPAQEAGLGTLEDIEILNQRLHWILDERSRMMNALKNIDWLKPYPTFANFILCKVSGKNAFRVKQELANRGILVRFFNNPRLQNHLRFSVGTTQDTDRLIEALKEL